MTTTSTFTGMKEEGKPSSRVLKPPGGGSSNIFGSDDTSSGAASKAKPAASKPSDSNIFGGSGGDSGSKAQRSARDGDDSFNRLFGDASNPQKGTSAGQRVNTHSNIFGGEDSLMQQGMPKSRGSTHDHIFGNGAAQTEGGGASGRYSGKGRAPSTPGSYNPITGADYKDLAPNHHALHVRETPKAQKEQPPLPCSDSEFQAREGKMTNVQTSTRVTNPPGGKTHKLW